MPLFPDFIAGEDRPGRGPGLKFGGHGTGAPKFPQQRAKQGQGFGALAPQAMQHHQRAPRIAQKGALDHGEHLIAGAVGHRAEHIRALYAFLVDQQGEFFKLLARREQVALDPFGDQAGGLGADLFLQGPHALLNPARQLARADGPDPDQRPGLVQRLDPCGLERGPVQPARADQQQVFGAGFRGRAGQGLAALAPGPRRAHAEINKPPVAKQRALGQGLAERVPGKALIDLQHEALGIARRAGRGPDLIAAFELLQGFIAADEIDGQKAPASKMRLQLISPQLHGRGGGVSLAC